MNIFQKLLVKILPDNILNKNTVEINSSVMYTKIAFDASVMNNKNLGIGMYDMSNNVRLRKGGKLHKQCSTLGEAEALKFTLKYANEKGFKNLALFTDSQNLSRHELGQYTKDYNFNRVVLTWIPRELNTEADKMSKEGQKLNKKVIFETPNLIYPKAANDTTVKISKQSLSTIKSRTGLRIVSKGNTKSTNQKSIKSMFKDYSYNQKALFISRLAVTEPEKEFGRMLIQATPGIYNFQPSNKMAPLIRMAKTIIEHNEMPAYIKKRFNKFKMDNNQKMVIHNSTSFRKEYESRKLQALKKVNYIAKKEPVMRTSDMMELVAAITA